MFVLLVAFRSFPEIILATNPMKRLILLLFAVFALPVFTWAQCTTTNATACQCKDPGQTDCDLLPDIQVGHPPFYDLGATYGVIEYSQTGHGVDNGRLKYPYQHQIPDLVHWKFMLQMFLSAVLTPSSERLQVFVLMELLIRVSWLINGSIIRVEIQ